MSKMSREEQKAYKQRKDAYLNTMSVDHPALKEIFAKYAGKEINEPYGPIESRDEVVEQLAQEVKAAGYLFDDYSLQTEDRIGVSGPFAPARKYVQAEYKESAGGKTRLTGRFIASSLT